VTQKGKPLYQLVNKIE